MKRALVTICNDGYLEYTSKLLRTFMQHNPEFEGDYVVLYSDDYTKLSDKSKDILDEVCPGIKFINFPLRYEYYAIQQKLTNGLVKSNRTRLFHTIWKFELFRLKDWDEVIFMDSDMIVVNSLKSLWWICNLNRNSQFMMCNDEWLKGQVDSKLHKYTIEDYLNTGLIIVRPNLLPEGIYERLVNYALSTKVEDLPNKGIYSDQDFINGFLRTESLNITVLPKYYNCWSIDANVLLNSNRPDADKYKPIAQRVCVVHYINKPHTRKGNEFIDELWDKC